MLKRINNKFCNTWIGNLVNRIVIFLELDLIDCFHSKEEMELMKKIIYEEKQFLMKPSELFLIYSFAKNQVRISGDYAEVGVFKGAAAKAICEAKETSSFV